MVNLNLENGEMMNLNLEIFSDKMVMKMMMTAAKMVKMVMHNGFVTLILVLKYVSQTFM